MTTEKDGFDFAVEEAGAGADAGASIFIGEEPAVGETAGPGEQFPIVDMMLNKDQWYEMFKGIFATPAQFDIDFAPLAIQDDEHNIARPASDSVYELLKIYYPAILRPNSPVMMHLMMCAPFIIAKVMVIRMIIHDKRREAEWAARDQAAHGAPNDTEKTTRNDTTGRNAANVYNLEPLPKVQ